MSVSVFISHAGPDLEMTRRVGEALRAAGVHVALDRDDEAAGRSLVDFMETALRDSNYCLLLWSRAAARSNWVRAEWQSAFHKAVESSQNFLLLARLEAEPVPELLRPRLFVDLFPEPDPGLAAIVATFQKDMKVAVESARPVAPPLADLSDAGGQTIYISSKTFAKTFPIVTPFNLPAAVLTARIVGALRLPPELSVHGAIGCRFTYDLVAGSAVLDPALSLTAQGVRPDQLLWLQVETALFSRGEPLERRPGSMTHRGAASGLEAAAKRRLRAILGTVGL